MENVTNSDNEKWMKEIWDWADEEELDDNIIPRESEKLIMCKHPTIPLLRRHPAMR